MAQSILYDIQQACRQLSLPVPAQVYDSQDETALLMGSVANLAGILINGVRAWQIQCQPVEFAGDGLRMIFDLPADFDRFVDGTGWAHADRRPVSPVDAKKWAMLKSHDLLDTALFCRLLGGKLQFLVAPADGETVSFEYVRKTWVLDADDLTTRKEVADKNGDIPVFDWLLMSIAVKVKWLEQKRMDTTAAMNDLMERVSQLENADVLAPVLHLSGGVGTMRYLDMSNIPDGGFGGP